MEFRDVVRNRRTHKFFNGEPVSPDQIQSLLEIAITAPCHRRNEPWRFAIIHHQWIQQYTQKILKLVPKAFADKGEETVQHKQSILANRMPNLGALIFVTYMKNDDDRYVDQENYAATCCAVQNLMLSAYDQGLGSFWSSGTVFRLPESLELVGADPQTEGFVAAIWLGIPTKTPKPPSYSLEDKVRYWRG